MKKRNFAITLGIIASFFVCISVTKATQIFSDGIRVPFLQVGSQGTGGVTYFNGTMINNTTKSDGSGNPLTMGDDVRIDGVIFRTEIGGTNPLKFSDSLRPAADATYSLGDSSYRFKDAYLSGTLTARTITASTISGTGIVTADNLADQAVTTVKVADSAITSAKITDATIATDDLTDSSITSAKISDGTVSADDLANESVTSAKIPIRSISQASEDYADTTADTTTETVTDKISGTQSVLTTNTGGVVFVSFSGVFSNDSIGGQTRAWLVVDNNYTAHAHTMRRGHSSTGGKTFTLAFNTVINGLEPGQHTFEVGWNTESATVSTVYNHTLDVIELKR